MGYNIFNQEYDSKINLEGKKGLLYQSFLKKEKMLKKMISFNWQHGG